MIEFGKLSLFEIEQIIKLAIFQGVPLYNNGKQNECFIIYLSVAKSIYELIQLENLYIQEDFADSMRKPLFIFELDYRRRYDREAYLHIEQDLYRVIEYCFEESQGSEKKLAWKLRYSFDRILLIISASKIFCNHFFWRKKDDLYELTQLIKEMFEIEKKDKKLNPMSYFVGGVTYDYLAKSIKRMDFKNEYGDIYISEICWYNTAEKKMSKKYGRILKSMNKMLVNHRPKRSWM